MRHFGSTDKNDVLVKTTQGLGATGLGLMGGLAGAALAVRIRPDWWLPGAVIGFIVPVVAFGPKKGEAA